MTTITWHATCAITLALVTILCCGLALPVLACTAFSAALLECALLLWVFRPWRGRSWLLAFSGSQGRLVVAWMTA